MPTSRQTKSVISELNLVGQIGPLGLVLASSEASPSSEPLNPELSILTVSVVVATFNRLEGIRSLLADLSVQDCAPGSFEVVVVDDESNIAVTLDIATSALAGRPADEFRFGLRLFRRPNGGPAVARDNGIAEATGAIIVIVDDDMHVGPGFVSAHQRLHAGGATVVLGNIQTPSTDELALFERFHMGTLKKFVDSVERGEPVVEGARLCTGNVSFRKLSYQRVGGFDTSLRRCEDRDLGIRFELAGERIVFGAEAISTHHSDHRDSAVWRKRNRLYGELDTKIAAKHPLLAKASPWAFLASLPKGATPVGLLSSFAPPIGALGGALAYRVAHLFDRRSTAKVAVRLTGLSYGLDYYAGVGKALGSPKRARIVIDSYRTYRRIANLVQQSPAGAVSSMTVSKPGE